jgi:uncharacterized membrane protein YqiK
MLLVVLVVFAALMLGGCYWNSGVDPSEVGVQLDDGINISRVVGPGRYSNGGWYAGIRNVDVSVNSTEWEDNDLVTSDKQPIGLKLSLSYHRNPDTTCIVNMYKTYNRELFDKKALESLVKSRVPNAAKDNTVKMTLDQMLFGRESFADSLRKSIRQETDQICVVLDTVQIANIAADKGYMDKLKQKAQVIQDREIAQESVKTAEQNVLKTKAETEIQLELARRQNLVNSELAKTYEKSPQYYELEKLKLLKDVMGPNAKFVFIPEGSSLSFIESADGKIIPVQNK